MVSTMRLDEKVISELQQDPAATYQAVGVVAIASIATAVHIPGSGLVFLLLVIVRVIVWWLLGSLLMYVIGTTVLKVIGTTGLTGQTAQDIRYSNVLRGVGFSLSPRIFRIFLFIEPFSIGQVIFYLVTFWQFACMVVSLRSSLGYKSTYLAALVVALAFIPLIILEPFLLGQ